MANPPTRQMIATIPQREMNKTEAAYAQYLDLLMKAGEVTWWGYEVLKIRLADKTYYTPDFAVVKSDQTLELHEVKGWWEDDARVKIKVAAEHFPAKFVAIRKNGGGWDVETF